MKENKNILPKKAGFDVPPHYFGNVEELLLSKIALEENLSLDKLSHGFKIPEAYFEHLEASVLNKIEKPLQPEHNRNNFFYIASAIAAVLLLYFGISVEKSSMNAITWDSVELSAIENYLDEGYELGIIDMNTSEYSDFIDGNTSLISDEDFEVVNEDVVLEYIERNVEISDFIID